MAKWHTDRLDLTDHLNGYVRKKSTQELLRISRDSVSLNESDWLF